MQKDVDQILSENGLVRSSPRREDGGGTMGGSNTESTDYSITGGVADDSVRPAPRAALAPDANAPSIGQGRLKDRQQLVAEAAAAFARASGQMADTGEALRGDAGAPTTGAGNPARQGNVELVQTQPKQAATGGARVDSPAAEPKVVVVDTSTGRIKGRQG